MKFKYGLAALALALAINQTAIATTTHSLAQQPNLQLAYYKAVWSEDEMRFKRIWIDPSRDRPSRMKRLRFYDDGERVIDYRGRARMYDDSRYYEERYPVYDEQERRDRNARELLRTFGSVIRSIQDRDRDEDRPRRHHRDR